MIIIQVNTLELSLYNNLVGCVSFGDNRDMLLKSYKIVEVSVLMHLELAWWQYGTVNDKYLGSLYPLDTLLMFMDLLLR